MLSRRQLLTGAGAVAVIGFNTTARAWAGSDRSHSGFHRLPRLDGVVLRDSASLAPYATDAGNIVHETPVAVLMPGSVEDIQKMVRFCGRYGIHVAARGQGHTTFGQAQAGGGLVIDMAPLNAVHSIGSRSADIGAGLKWSELVPQTVARGLTPPVLTGYIGLSIGGTLSVGGISPTIARGAQVDYVRKLEVVTGEGDLVTCSASQHRDLFEAVLAGLGQYGIITRAVIDLVPAFPMSRNYTLDYTDSAAFFRDLRTLLQRGELDDVYNFGLPDGVGGWIYQLTAAKHFHPSAPPEDTHLFRGLSLPSSTVIASDMTYLEYTLRVDGVIEFFRQIGLWDGVQHPWFDVFLPDRTVETYVSEVMPTLTPEDVGPTGFLLLLPKKRPLLNRPFLRVPGGDDWVFLFDILTAAPAPGHDPAFETRMLNRNRRLFEKARRAGGTRYPIGTLPFRRSDWVQHYGRIWPRVLHLKHRFDPKRILTPGPGIFA